MSGSYKKKELRSTINVPIGQSQHKTKKKPERGLKALASGSLAITRFHTILDKTEKQLELELERDNRAPPQSCIGRGRRKGEKIVHSKPVLLIVIILNVIDCILVLTELILDMYYVKGLLQSSEVVATTFIIDMKDLYPVQLSEIKITDVEPLYNDILHAHIEWDHSVHVETSTSSYHPFVTGECTTTVPNVSSTIPTTHSVEKRSADPQSESESNKFNNTNKIYGNNTDDSRVNQTMHGDNATAEHENGVAEVPNVAHNTTSNHDSPGSNTVDHNESNVTDDHPDDHHDDHVHSLEEELAHACHKASITILAILAAETLCKIFSYGLHFLQKKIEVFDCIIVFGSLFVDIYFLKGISAHKMRDFVIILAFLIPWRVIRVVNSLVVAVMDHEHFRLKLLYKQKKEVTNDLKKSKAEAKTLQQSFDTLKKLATDSGISEQKIEQHLALPQQNMGKHKKKSHSPLSFNHSFSFFHHHSPKSSPKLPHSTLDMKQQCLDKNKNRKTCNKYELQGIDNMIMINTGNDINNVDGDDTSCNTVNTQDTDTVVNVLNGDVKHD